MRQLLVGRGDELGPHINVPGMPDRTQAANRAVKRALALAPRATPVERRASSLPS